MIENSELIIGKNYFIILADSNYFRIEEAIFTGVKTGFAGFELVKVGGLFFMTCNGDIFNSRGEAEKAILCANPDANVSLTD